jgi:threonine dehydrogenase-like Zn-dependent dehydrogenase
MKALVYHGPGQRGWDTVDDPTISNGHEDTLAQIMDLTGGIGADVALEAVGVPATFELATELIRPSNPRPRAWEARGR